MMVLESVAEFKLRMPAELESADDAKFFKDFYVAVDSCLVVPAQQGNKLSNRQHLMILQMPKQPQPWLGHKVPIAFQNFLKPD